MLKKIRLISKFGTQTISTYILINISRSKENQIMKLGQLIEYNIRNIFLEKILTQNVM